MDMELRELKSEDIDAIVNVTRSLSQWFTPAAVKNVALDLKFQPGYVAVDEGRIIGFLSYFVYEGIANIAWLAVQPNSHHRGIGRKLFEHFADTMRAAGISEIQVYTLGDSIDYAPYCQTRAFYRAMGFADYRSEKSANPDCPEVLYLRKDISHPAPCADKKKAGPP
jgi:ribosomal protein S18 acetylase RimI-like enzyme